MKRAAAIALASAGLAVAVFGQASEHQRLSVETEPSHGLAFDFGLAMSPANEGCSIDADASLEYSWKKSLSLCLSMPTGGEYSGGEGSNNWNWFVGDPSVSVSYLWRGDEFRENIGIAYTLPIDHAGYRGSHAFSPYLSLATVRDPVILTIGLDARLCLPREEEGYLVWEPLTSRLNLSAWELLNDRISYRVSISPGISLGSLRLGLDEAIAPRWFISLGLAVSWDERSWSLRAGWNGSGDSRAVSGTAALGGGIRKEW